MTVRRPQDPMTKKIRDEEDHIATLNPYAKRLGGPADDDPGATTLPEDLEPGATVVPDDLQMPVPKAARAGAPVSPPSRSPAPTFSGDPATRQAVRSRSPASLDEPATAPPSALPRLVRNTETVLRPSTTAKRGSSWVVWLLAFLVLAGIGFGVSWFLLNPSGGGGADPARAGAEPADNSPVAVASTATEGDATSAAAPAAPPEVDAEAAPTPDAIVAIAAVAADDAIAAADDAIAAADPIDASPDAALTPDAIAVAAADADAEPDSALAAVDVGPAPEPDAVGVAADPLADAAGQNAASVADASAQPSPTPVEPTKAAAKPKNPAEATRLNEAGLKARKADDHDKALALYAEALTHNADNVWARYNFACELALLGRGREALVELTTLYKMDTPDARRALAAARKDSDFASIRDSGQFFRLTNF